MNKQKKEANVIICNSKELKKVKSKGRVTTFASPEAIIEMYVYEGKFYLTNFIELKQDKEANDLIKNNLKGYQPDKDSKLNMNPPKGGSGVNFNPEDEMIQDWRDMIFEFDKADKIVSLSPAQIELRSYANSKLNELLLMKKDRERMEMQKVQPDNLVNLFIRIQELFLENGYETNFVAHLRNDFHERVFKRREVNMLNTPYGLIEIIKCFGAHTDLITISI